MRVTPIITPAATSAGIAVALLARRRGRRRIDEVPKTPLEDDENFYDEITIEGISDGSDVQLSAMDRERVADDPAALGATWLEVLQEDVIESGPEPLARGVIDDDFEYPPFDGRDRPVADQGSGGRRGI